MDTKQKKKTLTPEEINRRNLMKRRFLWLLIVLDVLLIAYLVYQVVVIII
jgi:hypothetical protein